jgi:hypothetical protein
VITLISRYAIGNNATKRLSQGEETMTSFANVTYPTQHPGVVRAERLAENVRNLASRFDGTRATATLLLAAIVAALLVVANQVVETWTEGHLLAAWIVMWTVVFAALGLFAAPARRAACALRQGLRNWAEARRQAAQDEQVWNAALLDARVMADISRAMSADGLRDTRAYY